MMNTDLPSRLAKIKDSACPPISGRTIIPDMPKAPSMRSVYGRWCNSDGRVYNKLQMNRMHYLGYDSHGVALPKPPRADPYNLLCTSHKLDVALKIDVVEQFREYVKELQYKDLNPEHKVHLDWHALSVINQFDFMSLDKMTTSTTFLPVLMGKIDNLDTRPRADPVITGLVKRVLRMTRTAQFAQIHHNLSRMSPLLGQTLEIPLQEYKKKMSSIPTKIIGYIESYVTLGQLLNQYPKGTIGSGYRSAASKFNRYNAIMTHQSNRFDEPLRLGLSATWSRDICTITIDGKTWLLPSACIVEMHNKVADHISVLLFTYFAEGTYLEDGAYQKTCDYISEFHQAHIDRPKSFFDLAGSLEALCLAYLMDRHDGYENRSLMEATLQDLEEAARESGEYEFSERSTMCQIIMGAKSPLVAELACLSKMSGHPLTSTKAGVEKLYSRTTKERTIKVESVAWTVQAQKEEYLSGYYMNEGTYPPVTLQEGIHPRIRYCITHSKSFKDRSCDHLGSISMEDFALVDINMQEEIDYLDDMLPYLKDTSAALTRNHLYQCYLSDVRRDPRDPECIKETKSLLTYILCDLEELDHVTWTREFGDTMHDIGDFLEDCVIKLVPKEKELKVKARLFGCMTYKLRCANQVILRHMQKYLKKYSANQAMVLSELELTRKLFAFSKGRHQSHTMRSFVVCVDATGWNNAFTKETVNPVLRGTFDPMCRSSLISRVHDLYEETMFYAFEKGGVLYYSGQNGGIEGLQQASWMTVYTQQIKHALRTCPYEYFIIIKGDDVRVRFEVPKTEFSDTRTPDVVCNEVKTLLIDGLAEFGHEIKRLESYCSESIFSFSKKLYIQEIAMPSSYRQIQKTYGANNAFMFTLDDSVGSAFSNAHSACSFGLNPLASMTVAFIWSSLHILLYSDERQTATLSALRSGKHYYNKLTDTELVALLVTPSVLGGFPVIHLHNMFLRAESDLLASFCDFVIFVKTYSPSLFAVLRKLVDYEVAKTLPYSMLVSDPYCLPRKSLTSPMGQLQTYLKNCIKSKAVNPHVISLFSKEVDDWKESFVDAIRSGDILDPKLITAIYDCSIPAIQEALLAKFTSAKSIIDSIWSMQTSRSALNAMCQSLMASEKRRQIERIRLFSTFNGERIGVDASTYTCPAVLAQELREKGWGKRVIGITYPPPQHQVYIFNRSEVTFLDVSKMTVFEVVRGEEVHPSLPSPHFSKADHDPFLGHQTPSGTVVSTITLESSNKIVRNIQRLLTLHSMALLDSLDNQPLGTFHFGDLIIAMISMYTGISKDRLSDMTSRHKSGTRTHHLAARGFEVSIVPNMLKNIMGRVKMNTDTDRRFRGSAENYCINFLQNAAHIGVMTQFGLFLPNGPDGVGHYRSILPQCDGCLKEIEEPNTYMTADAVLQPIRNLPSNLVHHIDAATDSLEEALDNDERNWAVRSVVLTEHESLPDAREVIAEEVFRQTIPLYSRVATGFSVVRPSVDKIKDMIHLTGASSGLRSFTASEIVKIPSAVLVSRLRIEVISCVYMHFRPEEISDLVSFFNNAEGQTLPWAPVVRLFSRSRKLHSIVAEVCRVIQEPVAAHTNDMRDFASVAKFAGRELAIRALGAELDLHPRVRVQAHIPAKDLHRRLNLSRIHLLRQLTSLHPVSGLFEGTFGDWDMLGQDKLIPLLSIFCLIFGPTPTVESIQKKFAHVDRLRSIVPLVDEIWPTWFLDREKLENRAPADTLNLFEVWLRESFASDIKCSRARGKILDMVNCDDLHDSLIEFSEDLSIYCVVTFHDVAKCYSVLRSSTLIPELDDMSKETPSDQRVMIMSASQTDIQGVPSRGFERAVEILQTQVEAGPSCEPTVLYPWPPGMKLDLTHLLRSYGFTTTSWVKLRSLLDGTGFRRAFKNKDFYALSLADGDGGDSRFILEDYPKSVVIWNSINTNLAEVASQPIALRCWDDDQECLGMHPRAQTLVQMLEGGDIRQPYIQSLVRDQIPDGYSYSLIRCDADLPLDDTRSRTAIEVWSSFLRIYTTCGAPNSLGILKIFLDLPEIVSWILSCARRRCGRVRLVTLKESHCSYEAYVVLNNPTSEHPLGTKLHRVDRIIENTVRDSAGRAHHAIESCIEEISGREREISVCYSPHPAPRNFERKSISSLARYVLDQNEREDPALLLRRLAHEISEGIRKVEVYNGRIPSSQTLDHTARSLLTRVVSLIHAETVHTTIAFILICPTPSYNPRHTRTWPPGWKDNLLEAINRRLESLTTSARWEGMGGPYHLSNLPETIPRTPYPMKAEIVSSIQGAFKAACEYCGSFMLSSKLDNPGLRAYPSKPFGPFELEMRRASLQQNQDLGLGEMEDLEIPDVFVFPDDPNHVLDDHEAQMMEDYREMMEDMDYYLGEDDNDPGEDDSDQADHEESDNGESHPDTDSTYESAEQDLGLVNLIINRRNNINPNIPKVE